jgi:hypothetical protein
LDPGEFVSTIERTMNAAAHLTRAFWWAD